VAYARIGDKVEAPLIEMGKADVILGFEVLETARVLPMLKKGGTVVVNTKYIPPNCAVQGTEVKKPEDLLEMVRKKALKVHEVDGAGIAAKLGNALVVNTVLLGALSALPENPVKPDSYKKALSARFKAKYVDLNLKAFQAGRENVVLG
jgi:indolepyruvate ferredoxin oxidoreductase, beta subunit